MSNKKKIIKGSFLQGVELFLQIALAFVLTPITIRFLGNRFYGVWILVSTFIGYYGLLDFGLSTAVARYVARGIGKSDTKEINGVINTSFFLFSAVGLLVIFITFIIAFTGHYYVKNAQDIHLFKTIVIILGINVALRFPAKVFRGILTAYLKYDLLTYSSLVRLLLSSVFTFYFLKKGYGLIALAVITFVCTMLEEALVIIFSKQVYPKLRVGYQLFQREKIGVLYNYSYKSFIGQIADILKYKVDAFVIAGFLNVNLVTHYSVGLRFPEYFYQFMKRTINLTKPIYSQYEGKGNYDLIRKRFLEITKISVIVSVFVGASIIYYGKPFIHRWLGAGFDSSYLVAVILCVPWTIDLMQGPGNGLLYGISKHHYFAIVNPIEGAINLVLSIILVKYFGIYGVALGTAIPMMIIRIFIQPAYTCRTIGLSVREYCVTTLLVTTLKTLLPLLLYFFIARNFLKATYASIILCSIIQLLLLLPVVFYFVLSAKEREGAISLIRAKK